MIKRTLCEKSYYDFFKMFWHTVVPSPLVENWHIKYLCDEIQKVGERVIDRLPKEYDLIINISPGESKTTIATILFPVWLWIRDPSIKIISASYAKDLSLQHAVFSRDVIKSDLFKEMFSDKFELRADFDTKSKYLNNKKGSRMAVSNGSAVTGMHSDLIIIDDPVSPQQAESEVKLKESVSWINRTLMSRKTDKDMTPTIMIMQRLHEGDPTGDWLEKMENGKKVKHICLPATDEFDVIPSELKANYIDGLMNPLRTDNTVLEENKLTLGSRGYAGQYGQAPAPLEGAIFKEEWFQWYDFAEGTYRYNDSYLFVDGAYTENTDNDPSALMFYYVDGYDIYIVECKEYYLEFLPLIEKIYSKVLQFGHERQTRVLIEPKASGKSAVQTLKMMTPLWVEEDVSPTRSKVQRAYAASPLVESGRVFLPRNRSWTESFMHQVTRFPNANNDDMVDCLSGSINRHLRKSRSLKDSIGLKDSLFL